LRGGRYIEVPIPESATEPIFVDIVISSGSLIDRKIIDEVGLPRADFFIDFVDIEYDFRIARKGYKIVVVPKSIIYHEIGNTKVVRSISRLGAKYPSYIHPPWRLYYIVRNEMYTFLHEFHNYKFIFFFMLRILRVILVMLIYNHDRKLQRLKYIMLGFKDGIQGRLGKVYGPDQ
jgi:GT2 family glycosyltransferase